MNKDQLIQTSNGQKRIVVNLPPEQAQGQQTQQQHQHPLRATQQFQRPPHIVQVQIPHQQQPQCPQVQVPNHQQPPRPPVQVHHLPPQYHQQQQQCPSPQHTVSFEVFVHFLNMILQHFTLQCILICDFFVTSQCSFTRFHHLASFYETV